MTPARGWAAFVTAVQFLTRVPVPGGMHGPDADRTLLRAAVVFFPLVGGLIGAFTGGVVWAALLVWPPAVAVALGLIAEAVLTGAFHEDAVADCCDAFGGGWTRDDVLRILKDSRVGSFGALGLTLAVLLRGGCLAHVPAGELVATVAASAAVGRWAIVLLMVAVAPVTNRESLAKDVGERVGWRELVGGSLTAVPGVVAFGWAAPLRTGVGWFAVGVATVVWAIYVRRRIGGVTGDCLGCGCYLGQCAFLLAATAGGRG
jgi:adenosylcobinamide-GDP ribazoletransferase